MRLLITRPRDDAEPFAAALAARGVETMIEPMLEIVPLPGPALTRRDHQAILFTSVNGVRALVRRNQGGLGDFVDLPAYAVGDATARAARDAGFRQVESAAGDAIALAALVIARLGPDNGPLLHIAGSHVAGELGARLQAAGFIVRRQVLYEARKARALSSATIDALRQDIVTAVTFFSPRTAAAFVTLAQDAGVASCLSRLAALCLSRAVATAASGAAWRAVIVAPQPEQDALLGCLSDPALQLPRSGGEESVSLAMPAARKNT